MNTINSDIRTVAVTVIANKIILWCNKQLMHLHCKKYCWFNLGLTKFIEMEKIECEGD